MATSPVNMGATSSGTTPPILEIPTNQFRNQNMLPHGSQEVAASDDGQQVASATFASNNNNSGQYIMPEVTQRPPFPLLSQPNVVTSPQKYSGELQGQLRGSGLDIQRHSLQHRRQSQLHSILQMQQYPYANHNLQPGGIMMDHNMFTNHHQYSGMTSNWNNLGGPFQQAHHHHPNCGYASQMPPFLQFCLHVNNDSMGNPPNRFHQQQQIPVHHPLHQPNPQGMNHIMMRPPPFVMPHGPPTRMSFPQQPQFRQPMQNPNYPRPVHQNSYLPINYAPLPPAVASHSGFGSMKTSNNEGNPQLPPFAKIVKRAKRKRPVKSTKKEPKKVSPPLVPGGLEILWREVPDHSKNLMVLEDIPEVAYQRGHFNVCELVTLKRKLEARLAGVEEVPAGTPLPPILLPPIIPNDASEKAEPPTKVDDKGNLKRKEGADTNDPTSTEDRKKQKVNSDEGNGTNVPQEDVIHTSKSPGEDARSRSAGPSGDRSSEEEKKSEKPAESSNATDQAIVDSFMTSLQALPASCLNSEEEAACEAEPQDPPQGMEAQ